MPHPSLLSLFSLARGGAGDSGGGRLPYESALSPGHVRVPWHRLPCQGALGLSHQGRDSSGGYLGNRVWLVQLALPGPSRTGHLPRGTVKTCTLPTQARLLLEFAKDPNEGKWGREKTGKRKDREREKLPPSSAFKPGQVDRSWGSEFSRPRFTSSFLHLLAGCPRASSSHL